MDFRLVKDLNFFLIVCIYQYFSYGTVPLLNGTQFLIVNFVLLRFFPGFALESSAPLLEGGTR